MIVAVSGGKGGVGKSTTSWNLGYELDAVVVDADLAAADLPPGTGADLHDVLAERVEPIDAVQQYGPVKILPCGRTLSGARASKLEALDRVVERVEREYQHVIVDCPAGLARDVGVALRCADLGVLVTLPEKPAMVDAYRTHELASALETPVASIVLNKADSAAHEELGNRFGRKLGVEVTIVENQEAVADAQARWKPVREHAPDAQAVDAYDAVARRLERSKDRLSGRPDAV